MHLGDARLYLPVSVIFPPGFHGFATDRVHAVRMITILGLIGIIGMIALIVGYFRLQFRVVFRWDGLTGRLALLPLGVWVVWFSVLLRDVSRDPTAHNLFPLEMAMIAAGSGLYLGLLAGIRWLMENRAAPSSR